MSNIYKKAMDSQKFSEDFDISTINKLKAIAGENTKKPRALKKYFPAAAIAAAACVLVVIFAATWGATTTPDAPDMAPGSTAPGSTAGGSTEQTPDIPIPIETHPIEMPAYFEQLCSVYVKLGGEHFVYYSNPDDEGRVYRMKADGTDNMKVSDKTALSLQLSGDYIFVSGGPHNGQYFTQLGLYRIAISSGEEECLLDSETSLSGIAADDQYVYYIHDRTIYRTDFDGKNTIELVDNFETHSIYASGGYVYFSGQEIFFDREENAIYSVDGTAGFYRIRSDETEKTRLLDGRVYRFYVEDDWVYFVGLDYALNKMRLDATEITFLSSGMPSDFIVEDGWIYYFDTSRTAQECECPDHDQEYCTAYLNKIRTDGSDSQILCEVNVRIFKYDDAVVSFSPPEITGVIMGYVYYKLYDLIDKPVSLYKISIFAEHENDETDETDETPETEDTNAEL